MMSQAPFDCLPTVTELVLDQAMNNGSIDGSSGKRVYFPYSVPVCHHSPPKADDL